MASTVTYNGVTLAQVAKIQLGTSDRELSFSCEFVMSPANYASNEAALRELDKNLVIASGDFTRTYGVGSNCVRITPTLSKAGHILDSNGAKRLRLSVVGIMMTTRADGFREWFMSADVDPRGLKVISITGEVTGADAMATYEAGIDAVQAIAEAVFDAADYEPPQDSFSNAYQNGRILQFRRTITERLDADNISGGYDPSIVFDRWQVDRDVDVDRGSLDPAVNRFICNWHAVFPKSKADFVSQWDGTIREQVHARLKSSLMFSENQPLTIRDDRITYGTSMQEASGRWIVEAASGILKYSEQVATDLQHFDSFEKVLSGKDFDELPITAGRRGRVTQTVRAEARGVVPPTPAPPVVSIDGQILNLVCERQRWDQEDRWRGRRAAGTQVSSDHIVVYSAQFVATSAKQDARTAVREAAAPDGSRPAGGSLNSNPAPTRPLPGARP